MSIITLSDHHKEIDFEKWCKLCRYYDVLPEDEKWWTTCEECLGEPTRQYSDKPIKWKEIK